MAYFDSIPVEHWPQTHIGVVLWSLSAAANDWTAPDDVLASCTIPDASMAGAARDFPALAMVTRVLRPLTWFGLMECKADRSKPAWGRVRHYRKTGLFDRMLSFDVEFRASGSVQ